jgi:hypothetical protein
MPRLPRRRLAWLALPLACACGEASPEALPSVPPVAAAALHVAPGAWQWIPLEGAQCGNGTPTGMAVSPGPDPSRLLIFFAGGGACDDLESCVSHPRSTHLARGYSEHTFETSASEQPALDRFWLITSRARQNNPFQAYNYAYIPYCTGDLHLGDRVVTYPGADAPTHHVGAPKIRASLAALRRLFPAPRDVWLYGYSAGGFAAIYYAGVIADAFSGARLGIIDDSGLAFAGVPVSAQWNVQLPAACPACATDFSQLLLRDAARAPERRYAYLSYTYDAALPKFFRQSAPQLHRAILDFSRRARQTSNVKTFIVMGYNHIVLQNARQRSGGEPLAAWLRRAVVADPGWDSRP